jgi:hypothetical protein
VRWALLLLGCAGQWHWDPAASLQRPTAAQFPDAPAVVVRDDVRYRIVIPDRAAVWSRVLRHDVIAILSEAGFKYASLSIPMGENQSLVFLSARTIGPDGTVQEVTPAEVHDEDVRESAEHKHKKTHFKKLRLPGVRVGGLIEYVYELESPTYYPSLTQRMTAEVPILHEHAEIVLEGRIEYAARTYNTGIGWKEEVRGDEAHLTLDVHDLPAARTESFTPPPELAEPWWAFRVRRFGRYRYDQMVYARWTDVLKKTAETLYLNGEPFYKGVTLRVGAGCGNNRRCVIDEALAAAREQAPLSSFVNTLDEARPLKEVLAARAANNFEKALLVRGMLSASGVESYFAVTGRFAGRFFDHDFPLPGNVDHLLLYVPEQPDVPQALMIDPSCEACATGQLSAWIEGREAQVLRIQKGILGDEVRAAFTEVRGAPAAASYQRREVDATLDGAGALSANLVVERHGQEAVDWQIHTRAWLPEDWRKSREGELAPRHHGGRIQSTTPQKCDRAAAVCRHSAAWTVPGYAAADGERLVVPLSLLASPWDRVGIDKERHTDVFIRRHELDEEVVTLHLPEGWAVDELPRAATLTSPALEARLEVTAAAGVVTLRRALQSRAGQWEAAQYPAVALVLQGARAWRKQTLTLRRVQQ